MPTLKASAKRLAEIRQARKEKGLTTNGTEACEQASIIINPDWKVGDILADGVSVSSWKRFLRGTDIKTEAFKAFCQVLELDYLKICRNKDVEINVSLNGFCSEENKAKLVLRLIEL